MSAGDVKLKTRTNETQRYFSCRSYQQLQQGGAGRSDVFSALKYAVDRMPYRAGASKTVVLVTCDDEGHHEGDFYGDAMTMLQNYDVGLHHMTPMDVTTRRQGKISAKKSAKLAAKVLGFYGDAAVALVPTGDGMDLSRGLRAQLNNPKGKTLARFCLPNLNRNSNRVFINRVETSFPL